MAQQGKKETKFLNALKDVFVGAPVEGESGYINLMQIKARYFNEGVFPQLMKDIETGLDPFPAFREELFDKLYSFFHRYFSESGSIYFRYTPLHQNVYEQVYTDDRDVMLFYKTQMLYYVKTDRLFQNLEVTVDGQRFFFDVSTLKHKKANEKRALVFDFNARRNDSVLVFTVQYSERGRKTKTADILKTLKKTGVTLSEDTLTHAFSLFSRQSEVDYFINKDARAFLHRQFNLWLYQYVFSEENTTLWTETRIRQLQFLKETAGNIIDFIAQFEDELVKIWNKPKFALDANYVITLDKLTDRDPALPKRIAAHPGFAAQTAEWQSLGLVSDNFTPAHLWNADLWTDPAAEPPAQMPLPAAKTQSPSLAPAARFLPLDTAHFKDLEPDILALFDNLDDALDGWVINSDNYQALNTLQPKFAGQVQCIYIDPPYNTGPSEIIYNNHFKHSSWLTMMENRLRTADNFLEPQGVFSIAIDDNELFNLGKLVSNVFPDHDITTVTIVHNPRGNITNNFSQTHEYALFLTKKGKSSILRTRQENKVPRKLRRWGAFSKREDRPTMFYPIYVKNNAVTRVGNIPDDNFHPRNKNIVLKNGEIEVWPIDQDGVERRWNFGLDSITKNFKRIIVEQRKGETDLFVSAELTVPKTVWTGGEYDAGKYGNNLLVQMGISKFDFPKSVNTVYRSLEVVCRDNPDAIILDFFAGSGTTGHAVINLNRADGGNRKYILVEMGQHFHTVILPRLKKVIYSSKWKDGNPNGGQGASHFFKYYRLEQYEDTLRRAAYREATLFNNPYQTPYSSYVFLRDEKMLTAITPNAETNTVQVDLKRLYPNIDVAETLSALHGWRIKRIANGAVTFDNGKQVDLNAPPWELIKPLVWW